MHAVLELDDAPIIQYTSISSPLGTLWMAMGQHGLTRVGFGVDGAQFYADLQRDGSGAPEYLPNGLPEATDQFERYFAGELRRFDLPLDFGAATPFRRKVLQAVAAVPFGTVRSYRDIAVAVGAPAAMRAVGSTMAGNRLAIIVPCHRIIRSDGRLGEYALHSLGPSGVDHKTLLLRHEGVTLRDGRVITGDHPNHPHLL